jgi:hypothetical protein
LSDDVSPGSAFSRDSVSASGFSRDSADPAAAAFKSEVPHNPRTAPRKFGVWRFGVGQFSPKDDTRYGWTRVKATLLSLAILVLAAAPARALTTNTTCEGNDSRTSFFDFCLPQVDVEGSIYWGDKYNNNWTRVDQALSDVSAAVGSSTSSLQAQLDAEISSVSASTTAIAAATTTLHTEQVPVSRIDLSTVTSAFDAVGTATAALQVGLNSVAVTTTAIAAATTTLHTENIAASRISAGTLGSAVIASSIAVNGVTPGTYGSGTSVAQIAVNGDGRITSASNVSIGTLGVPAGGTGDTSLTAHGLVVGEGTSNLNSLPAMGNGGLVIGGGTGVDPSTGTLTAGSAITVTNAAGKVTVDLDSSSAAVKSGGKIRDSELDSSSVTLQGNGFNGNSQLVQTTAAGKYPALDGSLITGITGAVSGLTGGKSVYASNSTTLVPGPFSVTATSTTVLPTTTFYVDAGAGLVISPTALTGQEIWVSSGMVSVVSTVTINLTPFAADPSSVSWRMKWNCSNGTAAKMGLCFNNDSSSAAQLYNYASGNLTGGGTLGTGDGDSSEKWIDVNGGQNNVVGGGYAGEIKFETSVGGATNEVTFNGWATVSISASSRRPAFFAGSYSAAAQLTSIEIISSANASSANPTWPATLTCHWDLWRQGYQH